MRPLIFLFSFMLSLSIVAQDVRNLDSFDAIDVSGGIYVTLVKSNEHKAIVKIIKGDDNVKVITDVNDGELDIKFKSKNKWNWNNGGSKAEVELHYISLSEIGTSAGSKVYGDDVIVSQSMELDASSGSSIKVNIEVSDLEVDVSSGASIALSGSAKDAEVDVSSGSSFRGKQLSSNSMEVSASSGASADVWVTDSLEADASSGGSVSYKGDPKNTNIDSGRYSGGSVRKN